MHDELNIPFVDLNKILSVEEKRSSEKLWDCFLVSIFYPTPGGSTEDSFHCFWEEIIRHSLLIFCPKLRYQRNTKYLTSTGQNRPDVSGLIKKIAVWRGEEKGPDVNTDPQEELKEKLIWNYQGIPYLLAYHAIESRVTIDVIYLNSKDIVEVRSITDEFNLNLFSSRIDFVVALRNVGIILNTLACSHISPPKFLPEFEPILRLNGTTITRVKSGIEKVWLADKFHHIKELAGIYDLLGFLPFMNRLDKVPRWVSNCTIPKRIYLTLIPIGEDNPPKNFDEVKQRKIMITDI